MGSGAGGLGAPQSPAGPDEEPADESQRDLGTTLYRASLKGLINVGSYGLEPVKTLPFLPNVGYAFVVLKAYHSLLKMSWHGRPKVHTASDHPRIMRMKENALRPAVLDTFITCLMMACETHERPMIEAMVKAIVTEYSPNRPTLEPASVPTAAATSAAAPAPALAAPHPRLGLIKRFVPFRI